MRERKWEFGGVPWEARSSMHEPYPFLPLLCLQRGASSAENQLQYKAPLRPPFKPSHPPVVEKTSCKMKSP